MNKKSIMRKVVFIALLFIMVLGNLQTASAAKAKVKINKKKLTLEIGKSEKLKVKGTKAKPKWKSSNKKVVSVNAKGKVKAKAVGSAVITANLGGKKYKCKVTVRGILNAQSVSLKVGGKYTLSIQGTSIIGASSSNAKVASVSKTGVVTAKGAGTATITLTDAKYNSYTCKVKVAAPPVPVKLDLKTDTKYVYPDANDRTVYFYAEVTSGSVSGITLYKQDGTKVGKMLDDGKYSDSGDDIPNDNVYSLKVYFDEVYEDETESYYAQDTQNNKSGKADVVIYKMPAEDRLEAIVNSENNLGDIVADPTISDSEKISQVSEMLNDMADQGLVEDGTIYYDQNAKIYSFNYADGVVGAVMIGSFEEEFDSSAELASDFFAEEYADLEASADPEANADPEAGEGTFADDEMSEPAPVLIDEGSFADEADPDLNDVAPEEEALFDISGSEELIDLGDVPEDGFEAEDAGESAEEFSVEPEETEMEVTDSEDPEDPSERRGTPYVSEEVLSAAAVMDEDSSDLTASIKILYARDMEGDEDYDDFYPLWQDVQDELIDKGFNVALYHDLTVDDYKNILTGADLVIHHSHGTEFETFTGTYRAMCIKEDSSFTKWIHYYGDMTAKRVGSLTTDHGHYYLLPWTFFYEYYQGERLKDEVIYIGICTGYGTDSAPDYMLGQVMTNIGGAATAYGFVNSVLTRYNIACAEDIALQLTDGTTTGEARDHVRSTLGANDREWLVLHRGYTTANANATAEGAHLEIVGSSSKRIIETGIKNGSFEETSQISGSRWYSFGDARVLTKLGGLSPVKGSRMGIITTGIGSAENGYLSGTEGSGVWQLFRVPSNAKSIAFSYDMVSEEPMEYCGSSYDDHFVVELLDSKGNLIKQLASESINESTWYSISNIDFEGGDDTTYHTGWKTVTSYDIQSYANQNVMLRFLVSDVGDSIYDSAVLIDNVQLQVG